MGNNQVEISAPGVGVKSTISGNKYDSWEGTSMATPHVAGVAGLLMMHFPNCRNYHIRNVLDKTATNSNKCDPNIGYGVVQAKAAYDLLKEKCGGNIGRTDPVGGCNQLSPQPNPTPKPTPKPNKGKPPTRKPPTGKPPTQPTDDEYNYDDDKYAYDDDKYAYDDDNYAYDDDWFFDDWFYDDEFWGMMTIGRKMTSGMMITEDMTMIMAWMIFTITMMMSMPTMMITGTTTMIIGVMASGMMIMEDMTTTMVWMIMRMTIGMIIGTMICI